MLQAGARGVRQWQALHSPRPRQVSSFSILHGPDLVEIPHAQKLFLFRQDQALII